MITKQSPSNTKRTIVELLVTWAVVACLLFAAGSFVGSSYLHLQSRIDELEIEYTNKKEEGISRYSLDCMNGRHARLVRCDDALKWSSYVPYRMAVEQALRELPLGTDTLKQMGSDMAYYVLKFGTVLLTYGPWVGSALYYLVQWYRTPSIKGLQE